MLSTKIRVSSFHRVNTFVQSRKCIVVKRNIQAKSFPIDLEYSSYIIGKGIIVFTFTYCTLNWLFYKRMHEDIEQMEKDKEDRKKPKS